MKRMSGMLFCVVFVIVVLSVAGAQAASSMQVVNCSEWVSLRKDPDPDSVRLLKVPLGACVEECTEAENGFVRCRYNGFYGYVLSEYLVPFVPDIPEQPDNQNLPDPEYAAPVMSQTILDVLPDFPAYYVLCEAGTTVVDFSTGEYTVLVQRAGKTTHEKIMAVCYDPTGAPIWQTSDTSNGLTELTQTDAFIAGTPYSPLLVMFVSGKGFRAYNIGPLATARWECISGEALNVSGSIAYAVDENGNIYVCGAYDSAPICIAADGTILWKAQNTRTDIYQPWQIQLTEKGVEVLYNELPQYPGVYHVALYDYNGQMVQVYQKEIQ